MISLWSWIMYQATPLLSFLWYYLHVTWSMILWVPYDRLFGTNCIVSFLGFLCVILCRFFLLVDLFLFIDIPNAVGMYFRNYVLTSYSFFPLTSSTCNTKYSFPCYILGMFLQLLNMLSIFKIRELIWFHVLTFELSSSIKRTNPLASSFYPYDFFS